MNQDPRNPVKFNGPPPLPPKWFGAVVAVIFILIVGLIGMFALRSALPRMIQNAAFMNMIGDAVGGVDDQDADVFTPAYADEGAFDWSDAAFDNAGEIGRPEVTDSLDDRPPVTQGDNQSTDAVYDQHALYLQYPWLILDDEVAADLQPELHTVLERAAQLDALLGGRLDDLYGEIEVLDASRLQPVNISSAPGSRDSLGVVYGDCVGVEPIEQDGAYTKIRGNAYFSAQPIEGYVPTGLIKTAQPADRYAIVVDKKTQQLYFYEYGLLKEIMLCSTGREDCETPAGEFVTGDKKMIIASETSPDVAYFGIRINGRIYVHSVSEIKGDYSGAIGMLGSKASHGCIRVPYANAEWFYENLPEGTKVIILEG